MFTNRNPPSNQDKRQQKVIFCAFHPQKKLQTFCTLPQCLMPLCSQCLVIHNEDHIRNQTFGRYQQLSKLIQEVRKRLRKQCGILQLFSQQYTQDYWQKQKIIEDVRKSLEKAKQKIFKQVQRIFQQIQTNLSIKINQFHDSLHSQYQNLQAKLQHSYQTIKRKINIIQSDQNISQSNSTRHSLKFTSQISSQTQEENIKNKFSQPSIKVMKTIIQFYGNRQNERMQLQNKEIRKNIDLLKKSSLKVKMQAGITEYIQKLGQFINFQEFTDQDNIYYLPSRPRIIPKRK